MNPENSVKRSKTLASANAELKKIRQTNEELIDRVKILETENLKLIEERALYDEMVSSLQQLREEFSAFQKSYPYDVDKLIGLLLEIQNTLTKGQNTGWFYRLRLALTRKTGKANRTAHKYSSQQV